MKKIKKILAMLLVVVTVVVCGGNMSSDVSAQEIATTTAESGGNMSSDVSALAIRDETNTSDAERGDILIAPANGLTMEGREFTLYRILDATMGTGYTISYTIPEGLLEIFKEATGAANEAGVLNEIGREDYSASQVRELADKVIASNNVPSANIYEGMKPGHTNPTVVMDGEKLVIKGLPIGYYVIKDETSIDGQDNALSAIMVTTNKPAEIKLKGDKPSIEKKIDEDGNVATDADRVDSNNTALGKEVKYVLNIPIPDMSAYKQYNVFEVHDTMSKGLTFKDDVKITIGGNPYTDFTTNFGSDGENSQTGDGEATQITIKFNNFDQIRQGQKDNNPRYKAGRTIQISYTGILNEHAVFGDKGNPNEVNLVYSNDPNWNGEGGEAIEPKGETPKDTVITYTTGFELFKVDGDKKALAGAKFKLDGDAIKHVLVQREVYTLDSNGTYYLLKNGSYTTKAPTNVTDSLYASTSDKYIKEVKTEVIEKSENKKVEGFVDEKGFMSFKGLSEGTYTLKELVAPDGYNLLTEPITITIEWGASGDSVDNNSKCSWTIKQGDTEISDSDESGLVDLKVENKSGTALPETGSVGTILLNLFGLVFVVLAAATYQKKHV